MCGELVLVRGNLLQALSLGAGFGFNPLLLETRPLLFRLGVQGLRVTPDLSRHVLFESPGLHESLLLLPGLGFFALRLQGLPLGLDFLVEGLGVTPSLRGKALPVCREIFEALLLLGFLGGGALGGLRLAGRVHRV